MNKTHNGRPAARSLRIRLKNIPSEITTKDIVRTFGKHGNIVHVDLCYVPQGQKVRDVLVIFEPAPSDRTFITNKKCLVCWASQGRPQQKQVVVWIENSHTNLVDSPIPGRHAPRDVTVHLKSITFGILLQPDDVMEKQTIEADSAAQDQRLLVNFARKMFVLDFKAVQGHGDREMSLRQQVGIHIRAEINFSLLGNRNIYRVGPSGNRWVLVIALTQPPVWYRKSGDVMSNHTADRPVWRERDLWQRLAHFDAVGTTHNTPVALDSDGHVIDLGRWTVYWLELDAELLSDWLTVEDFLRDWNIKVRPNASLVLSPNMVAPLWTILDSPVDRRLASRSASDELAMLEGPDLHIALPFDIRYQLEVCISHGVFSEYNITRDFLEQLILLTKKPDGTTSDRAKFVLEYAADEGKRIFDPMTLFSDQAAMSYHPNPRGIPDYCALIRKVTVTPTRVYYSTPTVESTNRVVRHYKAVQDSFMRIQFTDERYLGRIEGGDAYRDHQLYERVSRVLEYGLRIGHWLWEFLAVGNSQIRENGAFMFRQDSSPAGVTCDSIREWMGNFSHIRVIARHASRTGQCFSKTRGFHGLLTPRLVKIADVERNGFCFTDGVGKISRFIADMIVKEWRLSYLPSVIQFRMGGCKGVLVLWNDLKGTDVHIRRSQEKFVACFNGLEVIRFSQFATATLNRQTITILASLGVPTRVFTTMTEEQLALYAKAMEDVATADRLLGQFVDENQTTLAMRQMVRDGFLELDEPFVKSILKLWKAWSIKALKEKARLMVEKGAFVLGCVDETGTLRGYAKATEGKDDITLDDMPQIFLQVPTASPEREQFTVVTGLCIVGRNPSLHPGDIRVVEAVDVPALHHIRNAVVFPLNGDRDVPSMCSGGDLDGDDFFVMWDSNLIPPRGRSWTYPPMDYCAPTPEQKDGAVTVKDLTDFFVLYMKNNSLPLIAHAHLGMADLCSEQGGAMTPKCKSSRPARCSPPQHGCR